MKKSYAIQLKCYKLHLHLYQNRGCVTQEHYYDLELIQLLENLPEENDIAGFKNKPDPSVEMLIIIFPPLETPVILLRIIPVSAAASGDFVVTATALEITGVRLINLGLRKLFQAVFHLYPFLRSGFIPVVSILNCFEVK